jgi:UDP-glucuronate 4-epimerase
VFVTGVAGFIGMHVSNLLLARGDSVIGIDNLNDYYDKRLKLARLSCLNSLPNFKFIDGDISDYISLKALLDSEKPSRVIHLAAQPGVRYSLINPSVYIQTNLVGFANLLEICRYGDIEHFVYASSSSVYGVNTKIPFSEHHNTDHPLSLYAASKKANELLAHSYSHLYGLPTTGLRFFTVYGPWGRPDMSPWLFTSAILEGRPINVFNNGDLQRDFTFVEDIAEGTLRVLDSAPGSNPDFSTSSPDSASSNAPYRIYNIGSRQPINLLNFIEILEDTLGKQAIKNLLPMQPGDVISTCADIANLRRDFDFEPKTQLVEGVERWVKWYKSYIS